MYGNFKSMKGKVGKGSAEASKIENYARKRDDYADFSKRWNFLL